MPMSRISTAESPYPELVSLFSSLPSSARVLDVGCGTGRNALYLAGLGCNVVAVDMDETAISTLRHDASSAGLSISTVTADMRTMSPGTDFDLILLDRVLHYLDDPQEQQALLATLTNLLSPSGIVCAVFVSADEEACMSFSSFVSLASSTWRPLLRKPVTHEVPGAGSFVFQAEVLQYGGTHRQTEVSKRPPYLRTQEFAI